MNIQLGIYETFSTIIPGFVYLVAICQVLLLTGFVLFDWKSINNLSLVSVTFFVVISYLLGITFSRFGLVWYQIFRLRKKDQSAEALKAFKLKHQHRWVSNFVEDDWNILLAFIRSKNLEMAREDERHLASSIMLRNISFGFFLLSIINLTQSVLIWNLYYLFLSISLFVLSLLTMSESRKFRR